MHSYRYPDDLDASGKAFIGAMSRREFKEYQLDLLSKMSVLRDEGIEWDFAKLERLWQDRKRTLVIDNQQATKLS